jgi:hypothetical protein
VLAVEAARRATLALAVEAARFALRRRQRLRDGIPLERALYAFVGQTFVEQYRAVGRALVLDPVDPANPGAEDRVAAIFDRVASDGREEFTAGMAAARLTGQEWGWSRAQDALTTAAEADYKVPVKPWATQGEVPKFVTYDYGPPKLRAYLTGSPFALANPEAAAAAARHAGSKVAGIDSTTRYRIRAMVSQSRLSGWDSRKLATTLRNANLPTTYRPMDTPSPLRHIRDRAHLIAVTETSYAYESGQRLSAKASQDAGLQMVKAWLTVGYGAVDDVCAWNEVQGEVPFYDAFSSGDTEPPAHPGCRCTVEYRALTSAERSALDPDYQDPFRPGGRLDLLANPPAAPAAPTFAPHPEPLRFGANEDKYRAWGERAMRGDAAGLKLNSATRGAFTDYAGSYYRIINESCRGASSGERLANRAIGLIDKAMKPLRGAGPTRKPIQLYRGIRESTARRAFGVNDISEIRPGMTTTDNAFQSMSADPEVSKRFGPFVMDVSIPAGTKVRYMGYVPGQGGLGLTSELETLIQRGCTLVAREAPKQQADYTWLLKVDLYPPPATPPLPPV